MTPRFSLLLLCLCLGGCVSVPLSTIVRMSTFDERDFVVLDPETVRVRITLPEEYRLNPAKSWLGVDITSPAGVHEGTFALDQERVQATQISGGLFSRDQPGTEYTLRLSAPSKAKFKDLQKFVGQAQVEQIAIRVVPILSAFPDDAPSVSVWIDLLLSQDQGYFTLLDGAQVPMEQIRAASSAAARSGPCSTPPC